jgi:hypothetical protein
VITLFDNMNFFRFFVGFPSGGGGNPITGKGPGFKDVKNDLIAEVWILCFKFAHNLNRFALTREDDTKMSNAKSGAIVNIFLNLFKNIHFDFAIWQHWCFGQFLQVAQLLAHFIFESVVLVKENMRELRENLKHKIRSIAETFSPRWRHFKIKM